MCVCGGGDSAGRIFLSCQKSRLFFQQLESHAIVSCKSRNQLYFGNANMHKAPNNILLCLITSMNINKMCYFMRNCMNGPFVFLVGWGRGGFAMHAF